MEKSKTKKERKILAKIKSKLKRFKAPGTRTKLSFKKHK